mmetsp:Transcript_35082/g.105807  ORF Transcript_35082/g.105807 Transcript_35082/m.105807 type:complete len:273 (-) Transcript_35082:68-886(-)
MQQLVPEEDGGPGTRRHGHGTDTRAVPHPLGGTALEVALSVEGSLGAIVEVHHQAEHTDVYRRRRAAMPCVRVAVHPKLLAGSVLLDPKVLAHPDRVAAPRRIPHRGIAGPGPVCTAPLNAVPHTGSHRRGQDVCGDHNRSPQRRHGAQTVPERLGGPTVPHRRPGVDPFPAVAHLLPGAEALGLGRSDGVTALGGGEQPCEDGQLLREDFWEDVGSQGKAHGRARGGDRGGRVLLHRGCPHIPRITVATASAGRFDRCCSGRHGMPPPPSC